MMRTVNYKGRKLSFCPEKDRFLVRGLIDIYDKSRRKDEWYVLSEYVFWSSRLKRAIIVPQWSTTDLSSIPKSLRWLVSVNERHRFAAIVHDMLYWELSVGSTSITRRDADLVFRDVCLLYEVPRWKAQGMYLALRAAGSYESRRETKFLRMSDRVHYLSDLPDIYFDIEVKPRTSYILTLDELIGEHNA